MLWVFISSPPSPSNPPETGPAKIPAFNKKANIKVRNFPNWFGFLQASLAKLTALHKFQMLPSSRGALHPPQWSPRPGLAEDFLGLLPLCSSGFWLESLFECV